MPSPLRPKPRYKASHPSNRSGRRPWGVSGWRFVGLDKQPPGSQKTPLSSLISFLGTPREPLKKPLFHAQLQLLFGTPTNFLDKPPPPGHRRAPLKMFLKHLSKHFSAKKRTWWLFVQSDKQPPKIARRRALGEIQGGGALINAGARPLKVEVGRAEPAVPQIHVRLERRQDRVASSPNFTQRKIQAS